RNRGQADVGNRDGRTRIIESGTLLTSRVSRQIMFSASAEFYDLIYSTFKDYAAEAEQIANLLRRRNALCRTLLDVACGSGEHARRLAAGGFLVDGLDLDPNFVRLARLKHPAGRFFEGDMASFHLAQQYDAVLCLFSSIGYLR